MTLQCDDAFTLAMQNPHLLHLIYRAKVKPNQKMSQSLWLIDGNIEFMHLLPLHFNQIMQLCCRNDGVSHGAASFKAVNE